MHEIRLENVLQTTNSINMIIVTSNGIKCLYLRIVKKKTINRVNYNSNKKALREIVVLFLNQVVALYSLL